MTILTTVMYHYVRPIEGSRYPNIKGLELSDFRQQLDYIQNNFSVITPNDLNTAYQGNQPLPNNPCLLTFDDGYTDHYQHVFPELSKRNLAGLFFAPKSSLIDRVVLDVNLVQFALACHPAPNNLAKEVDIELQERGWAEPKTLREKHFAPNRFDCAEIAYVKRILQHALPAEKRHVLAEALFKRHVTSDMQSFANELYLTPEHAQEMRSAGMEFGGHGDKHLWHGLISEDDLNHEINGAKIALSAIGAPIKNGFYSYPFGSFNDQTVASVSDAGFRYGFTVEPKSWAIQSNTHQISRLDTNDLPKKYMR